MGSKFSGMRVLGRGCLFLEGAGFDGVKRKPTAKQKKQTPFCGGIPKRDDTQKDTKESSRVWAGLAPRFPKLGALKDSLPLLEISVSQIPWWGQLRFGCATGHHKLV